MMKKLLKYGVIVLASLIIVIFTVSRIKRITPLSMNPPAVNQPMFSNVAINGYDPVAYFTKDKPMQGLESVTFQWSDATWQFASEENRALFQANPEKYAPAFGGYCSFAVSKGFTANTDPEVFKIVDETLYLFADEDMKANWVEDQRTNLSLSQQNWSSRN
ncbi:YHS domain-containing (seleno)protein [Marinoscillum sp. MHG1-6]|uniref:YHS domain-containing (seleno)protein n=1 Tax=Marinoscillum sp. MHG1-6 TaxID=2959627 RepID=UPI00215827D9|nr:YHS domain-containing (seleno)protein [Marinoscillum sp. MHG1-6]